MLPPYDPRTNSPLIAGMGVPLPSEVLAARCRTPGRRTPRPEPGQAVWYRHNAYGPLEEAEVLEVEDNEADPNTHRFVVRDPLKGPEVHPLTGVRLRELVDDPWWSVRLQVRDRPGHILTREARHDGSPGWLPMEVQR